MTEMGICAMMLVLLLFSRSIHWVVLGSLGASLVASVSVILADRFERPWIYVPYLVFKVRASDSTKEWDSHLRPICLIP